MSRCGMTRKEAREQAFFLIFEKSFREEEINEIIATAQEAREFEEDEYIKSTVAGVFENIEDIDNIISNNISGWKINRLSKVSLALLRLAIYEMKYNDQIPVNVAINEAVELCKKFATPDDAAYINGVLGAVAKGLS
ncbi:MAG TPA: transcription antitermination factor NusB [Clostridiales bacterium]|nr:transcription antitermination factor NusB [Clostridiales bacterium]